jgi:A/G-specific adenine glycosylase
MDHFSSDDFGNSLLTWYDVHGRHLLPWRTKPINPYAVYISEIMLQQTTVPTVTPYFHRFLEQWPDFLSLSHATLDEVLKVWEGLGYYHRARSLWRAAQEIVVHHHGTIPSNILSLRTLPGVGAYTAEAIAAIAWEIPVIPIDGNIRRILSRIGATDDIIPYKNKLPFSKRSGDMVQALMDLGSLVCRPKSPLCADCPVQIYCKAWKEEKVSLYPSAKPKKNCPRRYGTVHCHVNDQGHVWMIKNTHARLLKGLYQFPTNELDSPATCDLPRIRHTFSHFQWDVGIVVDHSPPPSEEGRWIPLSETDRLPISTFMKKIIDVLRSNSISLLQMSA